MNNNFANPGATDKPVIRNTTTKRQNVTTFVLVVLGVIVTPMLIINWFTKSTYSVPELKVNIFIGNEDGNNIKYFQCDKNHLRAQTLTLDDVVYYICPEDKVDE